MITNVGDIPPLVRECYVELKDKYDFCITLKRIENRYYLYRATTLWDSEKKKARTLTEYMGRINDEGIFIERKTKRRRDSAERKIAEKMKQRIGGHPSPARSVSVEFPPYETDDKTDSALLTVLSTNARADLSHFGRKMGVKPAEMYRRVKQLETKYGLRYIAEIDTRKLGYLSFFIRAHFFGKVPTTDEIFKATSREPQIQLVQTLSGYGILMYVLARDNAEITDIRGRVRMALGKYNSKWSTTPGIFHFNFIPLRDEFIEGLRGKVLEREYAVLRELNSRGTMEFTEIDKKYGFDEGRALYTYHKLRENGTLVRITATMQKAPVKYMGLHLHYIINYRKYRKMRAAALMKVLRDSKTVLDRYTLVGGIESPSGMVYFQPVFKDGDLDEMRKTVDEKRSGIKLKTFIVTNTVVGSLCYRKIDPTNTRLYSRLAETYNLKLPPKRDYEETGRRASQEKRIVAREIAIEELQPHEHPIWE
ncbi:MAG: hypothetical protein LVQ95_00790 [Candidatus Micrarchaeales archaeon]|nr:hypothetical protein [Candidatus Micrarchaeales archaeon]